MPHVTFIHGISNKPPAPDLLRIWRQTLAGAATPLPLGDLGVTSSLVYWADLLYDPPDSDLAAHEGVLENTPAAIDGSGDAPPPQPQIAGGGRVHRAPPGNAGRGAGGRSGRRRGPVAALAASPRQGTLERVPLPWFLKQRVMNAFLRDVHHYLFDIEYGPPGRPAVRIQQVIRQRFLDAVCAPAVTRPHVVVSHSMGTVIAYDCLKRVDGCATVDGLITIGSPLGLDEIQDKLTPGWSRADGFPSAKVTGGWTNLFDRLDPVCGFDPQLASDYGRPAGRRRRGHPRAERGHVAAFRHQVHAPTRVRGRAGADARHLTTMTAATDLDSLRERAQRRAEDSLPA